MKKNMKIVAALMAIGLVSPMAYATNGDHMMAVGSQSSALGGTGVANFMGAESAFANPAMLGKSKGSEVVGGITIFMPDVTNTGGGGTTTATSDSDQYFIPDVSYSSRIDDSLTWGIAMAGIAGMGVDYSKANLATHMGGESEMSIARVIPTVAYNTKEYGVGFSPIMQYGSLMLTVPAAMVNTAGNTTTDTAFGYSIGGYYNVSPAVTVAASYTSAIEMDYGTQLTDAATNFSMTPGLVGSKLEQPAEMKAGVAYTMDNITLTADYKNIMWSSATGYKTFNWKDQAVVALGVKYAGNGFWVGAGYNDADDPIEELPTGVADNAQINFFNNMLFPAIVKESYTFGGGYTLSKAMDIEAAVVITPEVTKTVSIAGMGMAPTNTTTHSQSAYSVSLRYKF
jgi:long-chain fatty acid transport protein